MDKTAIMIILDESPSMSNARSETVQGFNLFLADQKKNPKPATLSLIKFDRSYRIVYLDTPLSEVPELSLTAYNPGGGGTALYDSIGRGIIELGERLRLTPESMRPDNVLFVIITDGEENSSREFSLARIREMVKEQTDKYSWTFVFMGTDIDAYAGGSAIGVAHSNIAQYSKGRVGDAYVVLSAATQRSRGGSSRGAMFTEEEKKDIEKGGS